MATVIKDRLADIINNPRVVATRKSFAWHPSSANVEYLNQYNEKVVAGRCIRQQYYQRTGAPKTRFKNAEGSMKAMAGDVWSDWIVNRIKEAGFWYGDEVSFYDEKLNCSGRVDVIVAEEATGHPIGVEIKTTGTFLTGGVIKSTAKQPLAPKIDHVMQCMLYLYHYQQYGLTKWVLFYMNRDNFESAEHIIRLDKSEDGYLYPVISNEMGTLEWTHIRLQDIIKRWKMLADYMTKKELPPRDYALQYSNDKILKMFHRNELTKTDKNKVAKKLQAGPIDDTIPPVLEKGDWQCFVPDTLVQMGNGTYKNISNIKPGDMVASVDSPVKVVKVDFKERDRPLVVVQPRGLLSTTCTSDHQWLSIDIVNSQKYDSMKGFLPEFCEAKDLENKAILIPIHESFNANREISIDEASFLGYFTAEGCLSNSQNGNYYRTIFTIHPEEENIATHIKDLAKKLFDVKVKDKIIKDTRPGQETWKYRNLIIDSIKVATFIRAHVHGRKAINKSLSPSIMGADINAVRAFMDAAIAGDGCYSESQQCQILSTSSKILCLQYQQLMWRLDVPAVANLAAKPDMAFNNQHKMAQGYRIQWQGDTGYALRFVYLGTRKFIMSRIRSVTNDVSQENEVWDIEVNGPNPVFATLSGLVHNCRFCEFCDLCYQDQVPLTKNPDSQQLDATL